MKKLFFLVTTVVLLSAGQAGAATLDTVTQISAIDALLAGVYDGQLPCRELRSYGDFGIGTFNALDGEMVVLDGKVYQVRADGKVYSPDRSMTTPFAAVVKFKPDCTMPISTEVAAKQLQAMLDRTIGSPNSICAIRITGTFRTMKTRSVPEQQKPYRPLVEVTKNQPVFNLENVTGTIVGFRLPDFVKGLNVPGYHLHFLSADHQSGGHVLDFTLQSGTAALDRCHHYDVILPQETAAFGQVDFSQDRSQEMQKAEK